MGSVSDSNFVVADAIANGPTSTTANGSITTPAANAAIAATANLGIGSWQIEVKTFIAGTTVAALESDNMQFRIGATPIAIIINPVGGAAGATDTGELRIRVNLAATAPVSVNAAATGTTGAIYKASIVATRVA